MNNQTKTKPIINTDLENAPILRRFGAFFLDFVTFLLLYFLIFLAVRPILNSMVDMNASINAYNQEVVASQLYDVAEDEEVPSTNMYVGRIPQVYTAPTHYAEASYKFYTEFMALNYAEESKPYNHEWYLSNVLGIDQTDSLYIRVLYGDVYLMSSVSEGTSTPVTSGTETSEEAPDYDVFLPLGVALKSGVTVDQIKAKNIEIYRNATILFNELPSTITSNNNILLETIISFLFSSTIVYLTIPLLLKNGQTLGKLALKIGLATSHGYTITTLKIVLRYVTYFVLYVFTLAAFIPGAFVFGFLSLTFSIFSKRTSAIHDLIAGTRVYDLRKSTLYPGPGQFLEAHRHDELIEAEQ
jgi:uncharacterized RDD family membrane protein YckC